MELAARNLKFHQKKAAVAEVEDRNRNLTWSSVDDNRRRSVDAQVAGFEYHEGQSRIFCWGSKVSGCVFVIEPIVCSQSYSMECRYSVRRKSGVVKKSRELL